MLVHTQTDYTYIHLLIFCITLSKINGFSQDLPYLFLVLICVMRPCNVPGMLRHDISRRFSIIIIIIPKIMKIG